MANRNSYQLNRQLAICPHCAQPVKWSGLGRAWLLLVVPYLVAVVGDIFSIVKGPIPGVILIGLLVLAGVGVVMSLTTTRVEKQDAI